MQDKKAFYPNVDFHAVLIIHALGVPREFFTSFFASSRETARVAHELE
jgi:citrate synthase